MPVHQVKIRKRDGKDRPCLFFVEGAHVYIAGSFKFGDNIEIIFWKNGVVIQEIKKNKIMDDYYVKNNGAFIGVYSPESGNHYDIYRIEEDGTTIVFEIMKILRKKIIDLDFI